MPDNDLEPFAARRLISLQMSLKNSVHALILYVVLFLTQAFPLEILRVQLIFDQKLKGCNSTVTLHVYIHDYVLWHMERDTCT